jgi:Uncharacterized protein conserved in bacteria (DUF2188)
MSHVTYKIVPHEDGWAYTVDGSYSETFRSHDQALAAARRASSGSPATPTASSTRTPPASCTRRCPMAPTGPRRM